MDVAQWLWSTVFHARDFVWTERLDYFCAQLGIFVSLGVTFVRLLRLDQRPPIFRATLMTVVMALWVTHIGYMQLVKFDYGWNMAVSVAAGLIHTTLWLSWAASAYWCSGSRRPVGSPPPPSNVVLDACLPPATTSPGVDGAVAGLEARRYAWKIVAVSVGLVLAGLLEVFDFPPFFGLFDAHSIWHGLTPFLSYLFYSFLKDDALAEVQRARHKD